MSLPYPNPYCIKTTDLVLGDTNGTPLSGSTGAANKTSKEIQANLDYLNTKRLLEHNDDGTHKAWVDVRAHNGIGDGVTDDTQAIQEAINAANTNGILLVDLGGKTWRVTKTIDHKSNVIVINGTIYIDDVTTDLSNVDNYPIIAGFRIQSLQNCGFQYVKFTGNAATIGSISSNAIYIDYPDTGDSSGTDGLFINYCTFTNISRFGITGQCIGGTNWDISNNKFFLSGGDNTTLSGYGSQEGIQGGVDIIYDEGDSVPVRTLIDTLVFCNNQFIIDCSTQDYHGIAYKIQGIRNSTVSNNIVRKVGASNVFDHSSGICTVYLEDSVFNSNVCGGNITNIISLQFQGCVNVIADGNYIGASWGILTYNRGAYSKATNGLTVNGIRSGLSTAYLALGLGYNTTYGVLTDVIISGWKGEIYNYMHTSASMVRIIDSIITRYRITTAASVGPLILERNTIYAHASDVDEIYLHNVVAVNNRFIGTATGAAGYYIVKIYNSILENNIYEQSVGSAYSGYIRIYDGTISEVCESLSSFTTGSSQYSVYNSTGTEQKTTISTTAPTTNSWKRGDRVWNPYPAAGGTEGWICTTASPSGVWKTFGVIEA